MGVVFLDMGKACNQGVLWGLLLGVRGTQPSHKNKMLALYLFANHAYITFVHFDNKYHIRFRLHVHELIFSFGGGGVGGGGDLGAAAGKHTTTVPYFNQPTNRPISVSAGTFCNHVYGN